MPEQIRPPVVILTVSLKNGKRNCRLQVKEHRGRGKMAEAQVIQAQNADEAVELLLQRCTSWSDKDRKVIAFKAHELLPPTSWPLTDQWLRQNKGDSRR